MIALFAASAPPAVGVNENVTLTLDLPITRAAFAIENELKLTAPPIPPESRYGLALSCDIARIPLISCGTRVGVNMFVDVVML